MLDGVCWNITESSLCTCRLALIFSLSLFVGKFIKMTLMTQDGTHYEIIWLDRTPSCFGLGTGR